MTNLKETRKAKNMTQKELSEKSGVNLRILQYYEQGVKDINKAQALTVYRLAEALECKIEDLLEISYEMRYNKKEPDKKLSFKEMLEE